MTSASESWDTVARDAVCRAEQDAEEGGTPRINGLVPKVSMITGTWAPPRSSWSLISLRMLLHVDASFLHASV